MSPIDSHAYPEKLRIAEDGFVAERRLAAGLPQPDAAAPRVGVAISGGGIRSATFALGFFQALASTSFFRRIDFLSTVSGGSYFGAFLGGLFAPCDGSRTKPDDVAKVLADVSTPPNRWLRENGRYLAPAGNSDVLAAGATYVRNVVAIHVVLGILALAIVLGAYVFRVLLWSEPTGWFKAWENLLFAWAARGVWMSPYIAVPAAVVVGFAIPLGWAFWLMPGHSVNWRTVVPWLSVPGAIGFGVVWMRIADSTWLQGIAVAFVPAAAFLFAALALFRGDWQSKAVGAVRRVARSRLSQWLSWALLVAAVSLAFAIVDSCGQTLYAYLKHHGDEPWSLWAILPPATLVSLLPTAVNWLFAQMGTRDNQRPGLPLSIFATIAAVVLLVVYLTFIATLGHAIAWRLDVPGNDPGSLIVGAKAPTPCDVSLSEDRHVSVSGNPCAGQLPEPSAPQPTAAAATWGLLASILASLLFGRSWSFLNLSTFQSLYAGRLTRAYLGASNPKRWSDDAGSRRLSDPVPGDDISFASYRPFDSGGPLHLVNVTINETIDGETQSEYRDRKGIGLAVGPAGLSAGTRHHALWQYPQSEPQSWLLRARAFFMRAAVRNGSDGASQSGETPTTPIEPLIAPQQKFHMFTGHSGAARVEQLPLGAWVGISGAAVSTGLGYRTSIGLSLLAGMFNIRLGYWWDSFCSPSERKGATPTGGIIDVGRILSSAFPVQFYLLDEWLARFRGPGRRLWNLTDGGHFENTAAYELIRRRLPFIVVLDDGEDPDWEFFDLANLVRKARIDFGAHVRIFTEDELKHQPLPAYVKALLGEKAHEWITSIDGLRPAEGGPLETKVSRGHAALGTITYEDRAQSWILVVKPTLTADEPLDVLEYHRTHPAFPQEPTADQFFNEDQWESYRRLGEHVGAQLFGAGDGEALAPTPSTGSDPTGAAPPASLQL